MHNHLLGGLADKQQIRILKHCETVNLDFGTALNEPGQLYRCVYFPLTACISMLASTEGHPPFELRLIGNEGMLGGALAFGINTMPVQAVVHGAGSALRMTAAQFRRELSASPALRRRIKRYLYVLIAQMGQITVCARYQDVKRRLPRWLLMMHDRVHRDHFRLTQHLLAEMLGVQRSAVSIAASALQQRKLIRYACGEIRILDRCGLEAASCECYGEMLEYYT